MALVECPCSCACAVRNGPVAALLRLLSSAAGSLYVLKLEHHPRGQETSFVAKECRTNLTSAHSISVPVSGEVI